MNKLFKKRQQRHFMMLLKYWRLVFNDHFVIALFFLFGALAYGYSQWLPQLGPHLWWSRWLLVIWFTILAQLGRLATLIERPDPIFLLPQVNAMQRYLRQAANYSLILAELGTVAGTFVDLPFALTTEKLSWINVTEVLIAALFAKEVWLYLARIAISQQGQGHRRLLQAGRWGLPFIIAVGTWLGNPLIGMVAGVAVNSILAASLPVQRLALDWRTAVRSEAARMDSVYRFFNLFTDVPKVQGNVRRRRWATGLVRWLSIPGHPWSYLYARGLVRNADISGIVIRLTLLAMVIVFLVPIGWLNVVLTALFIYLIATQLFPLFDQFDDNVFTHLYPVSFAQRQADFQSLLAKVTTLVALLIALASLGANGDWQRCLINLVIGGVEVLLLTRLYFRVRIKKLSEEY